MTRQKSKTLQDFLNAAIRVGWLRATPEGRYPYTWNDTVTHELIAAFVNIVAFRLGIRHKWKWAEETFGIKNLNPIFHSREPSKTKRLIRHEERVHQVIDTLG